MSEEGGSKFSGLVTKLGLSPLESPSKVANKENSLFIGIPKERSFQEHRIGLTPESVKILVDGGNKVLIETNAGKDSRFSDSDFSEAGAEISEDTEKIFQAEIILKIAPPTIEEIELLKSHQTVISPIHLPTLNKEYLEKMMAKQTTALAFEYVEDRAGYFPFVRSMSEIAGNCAILIAAEYLSNVREGKGVLLGGISGVPPAKVVILGAGNVGAGAAHAALGLGATVSVFDNNVYKLMRIQSLLGQKVYTSILSTENLEKELKMAEVAIGAIHSKRGRTPLVVSDEIVSKMKAGSVIVDVSIDQGGCFETSGVTSHDDPVFTNHDVVHYCVPNIPSRVSRTASYAISNIITPILLRCVELGGMKNLMFDDAGIRNGIYLYKGNLTNEHLSERFKLKISNLDLLFSADI